MKALFLISSVIVCVQISVMAWAAEEPTQKTHALMTPEEQELYQKAKKRLYPGGKDEDSLKVQSQLPLVSRKMGPVQDAPSDEPEEHQESQTD
jgi:hypothetical protein